MRTECEPSESSMDPAWLYFLPTFSLVLGLLCAHHSMQCDYCMDQGYPANKSAPTTTTKVYDGYDEIKQGLQL